jgi:tetratricopeptide (TPR) repeat protein
VVVDLVPRLCLWRSSCTVDDVAAQEMAVRDQVTAGWRAIDAANYRHAGRCFQIALTDAEETESVDVLADIHLGLAVAQVRAATQQLWRSAYTDAVFDTAAAFAEQAENRKQIMKVLWYRGVAARSWHPDVAERCLRQGLAYAEESQDRWAVTFLESLGRVAADAHRIDEAEQWFRQSAEAAARHGCRRGEMRALDGLGDLARNRGDHDGAEECHRTALQISQAVDDPDTVADRLLDLSGYAKQRDRPDEEMTLIVRAIRVVPLRRGNFLWWHRLRCLADENGNDALQAAWRTATGEQLPRAVRLHLRCLYLRGWPQNPITVRGIRAAMRARLTRRPPDEEMMLLVRAIHARRPPSSRAWWYDIRRLTEQKGIGVLASAWRTVTGKRLPLAVRLQVQPHALYRDVDWWPTEPVTARDAWTALRARRGRRE